MKLGLTLPSFQDDPELVIEIAQAADRAGVDGVFVSDHLFRAGKDGIRPALECTTMMGAVAAETTRIALGPLVARASLRPPATLAAALDTVARIAPGRLVATLGAGDSQSRAENESFGLDFASEAERLEALEHTVRAVRERGYPGWVGGTSFAVRLLAVAEAEGWNRWGAEPARLAQELEAIREQLETASTDFTVSWGGLVVLGEHERAADAKRARLDPGPNVLVGGPERIAERVRAYSELGVEWVIFGPIDSQNVDNAALIGERLAPLLH